MTAHFFVYKFIGLNVRVLCYVTGTHLYLGAFLNQTNSYVSNSMYIHTYTHIALIFG